MFPFTSLCKTCDPGGQCHYWPHGYNLNKLGRGLLGDASYQVSRPCGFSQEYFFMFFPIKAYVKHVTPGVGHFLAPGA